MVRWVALVVVETAVLVGLAAHHFAGRTDAVCLPAGQPSGGAAAPHEGALAATGSAPGSRAADSRHAAASPSPAPIAASAFHAASEDASPSDPDDPAGIVIHGALVSDRPIPDSGVLWIEGEGRTPWIAGWDPSHTYAFAGLRPGTWTLKVRVSGVFDHREEIRIAESPNPLRHDVRLRAVHLVQVLALTPEGGPFMEALNARGDSHARNLRVWVTRTPPDAMAIAADPGLMSRMDGGDWFERGSLRHVGRPFPPGCIGAVQPQATGTLYLSLCAERNLLATTSIDAAATEAVFTLQPEAVMSRFGSVRLRVVDAASGKPLDDFMLGVDVTGYMTAALPRGEDGSVTVGTIAAGRHLLRLGAPDREHLDLPFACRGGETTDLGTLALRPAAALTIRVTSAGGSPVPATAEAHRIDPAIGPGQRRHWNEARTDAHGVLRLGNLSPGRYLVLAWSQDGGWARTEVEMAAGASVEAGLRLAKATTVSLVPPKEGLFDVVMTLTDASGLPLVVRATHRLAPQELRLPPGDYRVALEGRGANRMWPLSVGDDPMRLEIGP